MSESSNKNIKLTQSMPDDMVEHISSLFLPIQSALRSHVLSQRFRNIEIRSLDLDFSGLYSVQRRQSKVVSIIDNIFNQHKGSKINRFVLLLNPIGVEDKILSWINICLGKNIQELVFDFSKSKKLIEIPIDFSAIDTLTVLKLRWCKFKIPNNTPKGLKRLKTLSLMRTDVTKEMIDAIFRNCNHFESLELIQCPMYGILSINAHNHKSFKSLNVLYMPDILDIIVNAPSLECFKYDGYVRMVKFLGVATLKEAKLHYIRSLRHYDSSDKVLANMAVYTSVYVLATTNIFLEALTDRYSGEEMRKPTYWFWNLREFEIVFKAPTICTLFNIVEFLEQCPKLERVVIDINDFTFEPGFYWEFHHKIKLQKHNYKLNTIKLVDINGYKHHWHELDIVEFFVKNAQSLEKLNLRHPINPNFKLYEPDYARIQSIKSISPRKDLIQFIED